MLMVYKKISIAFILSVSVFLNGCAFFGGSILSARPPTEREKMYATAEEFYKNNNVEAAKNLYFRLSRNTTGNTDPIYDQSLWRLVKIYEKNDESEKALLTLDELAIRETSTISKNTIKFAQMKNNFRVANFFHAREIKKELDLAFKKGDLTLEEIYENLIETTDLTYDHRLLEELMFLGEVQKYFLFVMESQLYPENEQLTDRLIKNYEHFFSVLNRPTLSVDLKRKLSISLLDELRKFDQYKIDTEDTNLKTLTRFLNYSEPKQKILVESFLR